MIIFNDLSSNSGLSILPHFYATFARYLDHDWIRLTTNSALLLGQSYLAFTTTLGLTFGLFFICVASVFTTK
jgi:hypothetical protein